MARSDGLVERALALADIPACWRLSTETHWDQTSEDWRLMIARAALCGDAALGIDAEGQLIASAMTVSYGERFGWISMVLVTEPRRGQGLASGLLRACIGNLQARGLVPGLDATPAGRRIYLPLGFVDRYGLARMVSPATRIAAANASRAVTAADWPAILAYDAAAIGGERGDILRDLAQRSGERARLVERDGRLAGFALGRPGRTAWHVGPVIAADTATARALIADALAGYDGKVIIDIAADQVELRRWLERAGFSEERPYSRMTLGALEPFGDPSRLFAVAGPELG